MSARAVERALARLASANDTLTLDKTGRWYCLHANGDRRRRAIVRLSEQDVRALESNGALVQAGDGYAITEAGRARVRRAASSPAEAFAAQHRPIVDRAVIDAEGLTSRARGHEVDACLRRLAGLRDASGAPWLSTAEVAAAARLRSDWERGARGLVRGSDWSAPPNANVARGPANAREGAMAAHCDARRRVAEALERLAPPLRRVVERVCLREDGLEALERSESWPARSGKLALKLALAQLASG